MKKRNLKSLLNLAMIMMMSMLVFTACNKDDDDDDDNPDPDPVLVEDGLYFQGAGTAFAELDADGMLTVTKNEVNQTERVELKEIYVAIQAGTEFNIVEVAGEDQITWGPGDDFAIVAEDALNAEEPNLGLWKGSIVETETAFTVPEDALYHVVFDTELNKVAIAKVVWGLIGAATPGGWGESTNMEAAFDINKMEFKIENVEFTKADFKYRYSNNWKIFLDEELDLGNGEVGVRVNCNYGGAIDALEAGGANIVNDEAGVYTATMTWEAGKAHVATLTKTGEATIRDYTDEALGLIGDAIIVDGTPNDWSATEMLVLPEVLNTTYTYKWENVEISAEGSFKIRDEEEWTDVVIGHTQVTMEGESADNFTTNDDGNFVPTEGGNFDFTLIIDAAADTYTFRAVPAGTAEPELFMLGDGCAAGWDNANALPLEGTEGEYTITADLPGGGNIKFITTLGSWAPMYGTDEAGTSEAGNLVYRPTEDDPDPASIPAPEAAGSYVITVNTNDLTYTINPA